MILSPAKIFKEYSKEELLKYEPLKYNKETLELVERLESLEVDELAKLMKISEEIAVCNYERFANFNKPEQKGYYAVDYFYGEAFKGLEAMSLSQEARAFMEKHLRVLSGLYGSLRPLEIIQPYRLEMGTKLSPKKGDTLYCIWKPLLTEELLESIAHSEGERVLLNLASDEYSKAVDLKHIAKSYPVITLHFKVKKGEQYKTVGMYAKRARGLMVRYICEEQIQTVEKLKAFDKEGYKFDAKQSTDTQLVFIVEK